MQIIHYGTYDQYTEIQSPAMTAYSSTAFGIIQKNLVVSLEQEIETLSNDIHYAWAIEDTEYAQRILTSVRNATTLEDFNTNGMVHYDIIPLTGSFDKEA